MPRQPQIFPVQLPMKFPRPSILLVKSATIVLFEKNLHFQELSHDQRNLLSAEETRSSVQGEFLIGQSFNENRYKSTTMTYTSHVDMSDNKSAQETFIVTQLSLILMKNLITGSLSSCTTRPETF